MPQNKSAIGIIGKRRSGRFYRKTYPTRISFGIISGQRDEHQTTPKVWDVFLDSVMKKQHTGNHNYNTTIKDMVLYTNYSANKWLQDEIIKNYPKLAPAQILQKQLDIIHGKYQNPNDIKMNDIWMQKRTSISKDHPHNIASMSDDSLDLKEIENYEKFLKTGIHASDNDDFDDDEIKKINEKYLRENIRFASLFEKNAQSLTGGKQSPF